MPADNVTIPATGSGTATPVIATEDEGGVHYQKIKIVSGEGGVTSPALSIVAEDAVPAGGEGGIIAMGIRKDTPANTSGADGDFETFQVSGGKMWVAPLGFFATISTDVTRAANTTTYTANDNVGSTPSGGYTWTSAARKSGGSGIITDMWITFEEDAATPLQGEVHIFDTAFTEVADNAALVFSDAEAKTQLAVIPFSLFDNGNQEVAHIQNLAIGFTTVGSANLRFAVKAKNAYVPTTNSSVVTFRIKVLQID